MYTPIPKIYNECRRIASEKNRKGIMCDKMSLVTSKTGAANFRPRQRCGLGLS